MLKYDDFISEPRINHARAEQIYLAAPLTFGPGENVRKSSEIGKIVIDRLLRMTRATRSTVASTARSRR